ncbi:Anhydrotetracycline monooxygenase [Golovinomyces cichoracearum]|uniref:Anhydrotetracycline monooxygenase n=1 Tax=Golovinomyces cichoracearum TaxID=62708 RepID=A0A420IMG0_9PEZI|nr:Anhydrotetracycline monooxygenase [Golovinomyces cichoracearum]
MDCEVLIIGAGPTGLMLALELSREQIPFRILDSHYSTKTAHQSRSIVVHSRSLELLARHDLAESFIAKGLLMEEIRFFLKQTLNGKSSYPGSLMNDTIYKKPLIIRQPLSEQLLEKRLCEYGGIIERGASAKKMVIDEDGERVSVLVQHRIQEEEEKVREELINCKYVVGCDGANSMVRKFAGIDFPGTLYPQELILIDAQVDWNNKICPHVFIDKEFVIFIPLDETGINRIICRRPPNDTSTISSRSNLLSGSSPYQEPSLSEFHDTVISSVPGTTRIHSPIWSSSFRVSRRLASTYSVGRIFLAGDAAHVHAPIGGQGMNTGIQDAVNLGWKLARVIKSTAPSSLLNSYNVERYKVGSDTVENTDRMFNILITTNPVKIWLRNFLFRWVLPYFLKPDFADRKIRYISQLSIRYRNSPVVGTASVWKGILRGGDRAPDGWMMNPEGENITLHRLFRTSNDHLFLFSGLDTLESRMVNDTVQQLKLCSSVLVVHKIYDGNFKDKTIIDGYIDPGGKVHTLYQFIEPGYVLVRPDGYISFIGPMTSLDELKNWMNSYMQG